MIYWERVKKFDQRAVALADRHYSRRKVGSPQFMPPGQTIVLLTRDAKAVFGWWRPHPDSGLKSMNGLDGWTCTIFRNESNVLSSELVIDAEKAIEEFGYDIGPDGLLTYVWDKRIKSKNPGYCFKLAGWKAVGRSADKRKTLLQKMTENRMNPTRECPKCGSQMHYCADKVCAARWAKNGVLDGVEIKPPHGLSGRPAEFWCVWCGEAPIPAETEKVSA